MAIPPSAGDEALQRANEWKEVGNVEFREKNFTAAVAAYTQALALNPQNQALYSNRSAAYISLGQLPQALDDANQAIEYGPRWPKAYRRKASVLDAQRKFHYAKLVYERAIEITRADSAADGTGKKEIEEMNILIQALNRKIASTQVCYPGSLLPAQNPTNMPGHIILREAETRKRNGELMGRWPPVGSCKRRLWIAEMQFLNARAHLHEFQVRHSKSLPPNAPEGAEIIFGRLQTLEELTTAMVEDIRVARFEQTDLEKLALCYKLEQQQRNALGPELSPKETILEYSRRLIHPRDQPSLSGPSARRATGWDYVRPALQLSIRSRVMNGFLKTVFDGQAAAAEEFHLAAQLIEEARKMWPEVDGSIRGRSLEETFLRGIKVAQGNAMIVEFHRNQLKSSMNKNRKRAYLQEIIILGNWLLSSFRSNPHPPEEEKNMPAGMDAWWSIYYHHYANPKAYGHVFIAFGNLHIALELDTFPLDTEDGRDGPAVCDPVKLGIAAINYAKAAAWMPFDCPDRANSLWYAILATIYRGGFYLGDLAVLCDMAAKAATFFTPYFPSSIIPENHAGKMAFRELNDIYTGQPGTTILSPMTHWPDGVELDTSLLNSATDKYITQLLHDCTHGLLVITEIIRETWKERVELYGESSEAIGVDTIWATVDPNLREDWETIINHIGAISNEQQMCFFNGWAPPEDAP